MPLYLLLCSRSLIISLGKLALTLCQFALLQTDICSFAEPAYALFYFISLTMSSLTECKSPVRKRTSGTNTTVGSVSWWQLQQLCCSMSQHICIQRVCCWLYLLLCADICTIKNPGTIDKFISICCTKFTAICYASCSTVCWWQLQQLCCSMHICGQRVCCWLYLLLSLADICTIDKFITICCTKF